MPTLIRSLKKIHFIFLLLSKIISRKGLNAFLKKEFCHINRGEVVGNIGAGGKIEADLRKQAVESRFSVISLDIDPSRNPDVVLDITSPNLPENSFDVIVMAEVLEHVADPHAAVKGIRYLLKPGGKLILTVPFIFPIHDRPYDYFRYTRFGLEHLFGEMQELEVRQRNSWAEAISVLMARLIMERSISARLASPFAVVLALLMVPLALFLGTIIKTDFITTGYLLTCKNPCD
jgi:SAM-dependent methyltransferase